ncbi:hypothetical protein [Candidatus Coxiella mudrowiae]|uniref:hypothetical protein n=1 Tax=Candidatus Coxiella mudrowiae TaxID=2054173 RepID=UPI00314510F1
MVFYHTKLLSAQKIFQILKKEYEQHYQLICLSPFGFNNSQTLAVRKNFEKASPSKFKPSRSYSSPTHPRRSS